MPVNIRQTPAGRVVWGDTAKPQKKTDDNGKVVTDADGNAVLVYTFGLAVPKNDCQPMFDAMTQAAAEEFPQGTPDNFAWKFKDGDTGKDGKGNPLRDKEGYAGCNIFTVSQQIPAGNYEYDHSAGKWIECGTIKRGDWVTLELDVKAHKAVNTRAKPGLYLNQRIVMLHHRDKEIQGGAVDPNARGFAPPPAPTPPANAPAPPGSQPPTSATGSQSSAPPPSAGPRPPGGGPTPTPHQAFLRGPKPDDEIPF